MFLLRFKRLAVSLAVIGVCFTVVVVSSATADNPHNGLLITFDVKSVVADAATGDATVPITQCNYGATTVSYFLVFNGNVLTERVPLTLASGECEPANISASVSGPVAHWTIGGYDVDTGMNTGPTDHLVVFDR